MSNSETPTATEPSQEYDRVDPPIGWDGQTLDEMLTESERLLDETGHYQGPVTGAVDQDTRKALRAVVGQENLEERWDGTGDEIDRKVIDYLVNKFL